jgi:hypothetical protein
MICATLQALECQKYFFFANFKGDLQDFRWVVPAAGDRLFQYDLPIDE